MKAPWWAGTVLLLVASACSSNPGDTRPDAPDASSQTPSAPALDATQRWAAAKAKLLEAGTGHFDFVARREGLGIPWEETSAVFDLKRPSFELSQTIGSGTMTVKALPGGATYLQDRDRGNWSDCWLPLGPGDFGFTANAVMPRLVKVVLQMTVPEADQPGPDLRARLDAAAALRALNSTQETPKQINARLKGVQVPVSLTFYDDRALIRAAFSGADLLKAARTAGVKLEGDLAEEVVELSAMIEIDRIGQPVSVTRPTSGKLLPADASDSDTCPDNR